MKYFVFEWNKPLGKIECPYAFRWRLDFWWFSFRVHKWLKSDDTRAYHNHSTNFITFILQGSYYDITPTSRELCKQGDVKIRYRNHRHFVEVAESALTFLITFGRPQKYAFWLVDTDKRKNRDKYFKEHGHQICD